MGLRRIHVKKEITRPNDSGLFDVLDVGSVHGHLGDTEARLRDYLSYQDSKSVHVAVLEAELRKAEALTLAHRYLIWKV